MIGPLPSAFTISRVRHADVAKRRDAEPGGEDACTPRGEHTAFFAHARAKGHAYTRSNEHP